MADFFSTSINAAAIKTLGYRRDKPRSKWFSERTPWIRFSSSGNIDKSDAERKAYILYNGQKNKIWSTTTNSAKSGKNRPAPGVTDLSITPKNAKGTVKEIEINWQCWTHEDLNVLEKLYMTPGLTCTVEFGWSKKILEDGTTSAVGPSNIGPLDAAAFYTKADSIIKNSGGNASAVQGMIVDFNWSINKDGGFDCTTKLISKGDAIASMGIKKNTMGVKLSIEGGEDKAGHGGASNMQASIEAAKMAMKEENQMYLSKVNSGRLYGMSLDMDSSDTELQEDVPWYKIWIWDSAFTQYVSWAWIEDVLITSNVSFTSSPTPTSWNTAFAELKPSTEWSAISPKLYSGWIQDAVAGDIPTSKVKNYPFLESQDSQICCLPPFRGPNSDTMGYPDQGRCASTSGLTAITSTIKNHGYSFAPDSNNQNEGYLRNIWVNVRWVEKIYNEHYAEGTVIDFVKALLDGINDACGGIWEFEVITLEKFQCLKIIDTSLIKKGTSSFTFNPYKTNTMVRNVSISTEVSEKLKGAVLEGAARANKKGKTMAGSNSNAALSYAFFGAKITDESSKDVVATSAYKEGGQSKQLADVNEATSPSLDENKKTLLEAYQELADERSDESVKAAKAAFAGVKDWEEPINVNASPILPLNLELEIDGIEGLQWGNTINCTYLPQRYADKLSFKVTKVSHTITKDDWVTKIETLPLVKS